MCGISGLWSNSANQIQHEEDIRNMSNSLIHRGPDNEGFWSDPERNLYLGHRRLSILDLSPAGIQPMMSHNQRYIMTFNGEIYNNLDLRNELEKVQKNIRWRGYSDTEILLELISYFGLENALLKCRGMFALAIWDRSEKCLSLARDRMGEKPLYYGFSGSDLNKTFLFGSELSSLRNWRYFDNSIDKNSLSQLINYHSISAPNTIFKGIYQLLPGHTVTLNNPKIEYLPESKPWWELKFTIEESRKDPIFKVEEAILSIEESLKKAIKLQSHADVPLGTFLSGGIDSSLITALLQSQSSSKIKTFTIGFENKEFNEAPFSKNIAKYLGTDHREFYLTSKDAQEIIPKLNQIYSEPFADASQIPTHLVCREASKIGLKVALSGDGGDELFGGYSRYLIAKDIWGKIGFIPFETRKILGKIGLKISPKFLNNFSDFFGINQIGTKVSKLSERLKYIKKDDELYYSLVSQWKDPSFLFNNELLNEKMFEVPNSIKSSLPKSISNELVSKMMFYDSLNYLPNDILTKVDRAAMSTSLETRAPFLDHKVIETAWRVDMNLKIKSNSLINANKWILRKLLVNYLPKEFFERPKAGFGIPISEWLRGPLKEWASDLISKDTINKSGYLRFSSVSKLWDEHLSCEYDNGGKLWPILMWQSWLENNSSLIN